MQAISKVIIFTLIIISTSVYAENVNSKNSAKAFFSEHNYVLTEIILKLDSNKLISRVDPDLGTLLIKDYEQFSETEKKTLAELMVTCKNLGIINIAVTRYDSGEIMAIWFTLNSEGILARGTATSLFYLKDPSLFARFKAAYDAKTEQINDSWYVWENIPSRP
ncbi:hypothetical protein [Catenovulum maritimum]|uniref:Uncharacterized protein n=1 Tax=Catenovulum maritimum TaxID=1513271 RepID=A0A0J8GUQ4_9ALTE|nr:hypothetical protein [Catenovulum maritimum]KMT64428.1 hypothetical protein XM47_14110 [Catenovulum maritimum]